jgi:demethoxyubiquinone hydroxylase (CLK1/Coq7/Cat5 family)
VKRLLAVPLRATPTAPLGIDDAGTAAAAARIVRHEQPRWLAARPRRRPAELARDLVPELRSDHAGETGAVWIYNGMLPVVRSRELRAFARRHRDTGRRHLARIAAVLALPRRSRLLLAWRRAGFATGALPALFGARAVYGTVAAVETFVDRHYQQQIERLDAAPPSARRDALRALLAECQATGSPAHLGRRQPAAE